MSTSSEERFWNWFVEHEDELYLHNNEDVDAREELFDRLQIQLHQVDEHLAFEFSGPQAVREFILSADGIRESFPAVLRLQETKPDLPRWDVIFFRPRRDPVSTICMDDLELNSKDFEFTLLTKGTTIGLSLYLPGYKQEDSRFKMIGYLFLDQALGEFDVETKIALIEFLSLDDQPDRERWPFAELPEEFDQLYDRLNGRSGRPS